MTPRPRRALPFLAGLVLGMGVAAVFWLTLAREIDASMTEARKAGEREAWLRCSACTARPVAEARP